MVTGAPPIPRIELAVVPTPLLKLERLSQELGIELWVKRDDLTGLLETGNKIRKLEFLVGEAYARSADTLITCGTRSEERRVGKEGRLRGWRSCRQEKGDKVGGSAVVR